MVVGSLLRRSVRAERSINDDVAFTRWCNGDVKRD